MASNAKGIPSGKINISLNKDPDLGHSPRDDLSFVVLKESYFKLTLITSEKNFLENCYSP